MRNIEILQKIVIFTIEFQIKINLITFFYFFRYFRIKHNIKIYFNFFKFFDLIFNYRKIKIYYCDVNKYSKFITLLFQIIFKNYIKNVYSKLIHFNCFIFNYITKNFTI